MTALLTPSQTVGPFFGYALPIEGGEQMVVAGRTDTLTLTGVLYDGAGTPVPDGLLEVWQADEHGHFPRPGEPVPAFTGFGRCPTADDGRYRFVTVKPGVVPARDGAPQAPHLDVVVFARGLLNKLVTRVYFPDEPAANDADPVLSSLRPEERTTLIARPSGDGGLVHDIRLQGDGETVFFSL